MIVKRAFLRLAAVLMLGAALSPVIAVAAAATDQVDASCPVLPQ